MFNVLF